MLALSDLFTEPAQFRWLFEHFSEIQKVHPAEDEMLHNLLRIGLCKAIAVLGLHDPDLLERTRKSLEAGMKVAFLPTRLGCLHSFLYLSQCEAPEVVSEVNTHILPFVLDYLQMYLQVSLFVPFSMGVVRNLNVYFEYLYGMLILDG